LLFLLVAVGCTDPATKTLLVPEQPLGNAAAMPNRQASYGPVASVETAARVDSMGRRILTANPQLGLQAQFLTIGAPSPEIFHSDLTKIVITEGLVKQCASDGQLAAVLCIELGKMISEREALTAPKTRAPDRDPPMEVRVGSDNAFSPGAADQTYLAERWKFDRDRDRSRNPKSVPSVSLPPDPQTLASTYLTKTGFPPADLDAVVPILTAASKNSAFAKQMTPPAPTQPWTK
jgi:hypothetical protein